MFSRRIPLGDLIDLCRVLRHQLGAGMALQQVLQRQGERGRASFRGIATRLASDLQKGVSLSDALDKERDAFPPLFLAMAKLGETTGHLAEIFGELERYYQLELQLKRQFRSATILPIAQFFFATLIIAGVIYVLGFIASLNNTKPLMTMFGLSGAAGSGAFLGVVFGAIALGWAIYVAILRAGRQKAWMHRLLLGIPSLGPCLYALAMSRLTLALQLTLDSGLSIGKALRLSLEATGNAHFVAHADDIVNAIKKGRPLHDALENSRLFGSDVLDMVVSAEASGSVPEMMRHLAQQYQEETGRRMTMLTRVAGGAVWCCVAGFIIWAIFSLYGIYFGALAQFAK
ncbi:MAG: type II secretion system F family protein [Planctomycetes bacterium]|nr:type II secretion system F family protein [Planctomycetota bacterium]